MNGDHKNMTMTMSFIAEVRHQSCLVWNKLKEKHLKPFEAVCVDVTLKPAIQTHYKSTCEQQKTVR